VVAGFTFHGTSGHAARPWLADSARERSVRGLAPFFEAEPRRAVVDGLEFRGRAGDRRYVSSTRGMSLITTEGAKSWIESTRGSRPPVAAIPTCCPAGRMLFRPSPNVRIRRSAARREAASAEGEPVY